MPLADVLRFSENVDTMTFSECFAFIERSRRQLMRLQHLPGGQARLDSEEITSILADLDKLELGVRSDPRCPANA
jgi:hypothetical protein